MNKSIGKMCSGSMFVVFLLASNNLHVPNKVFAMESTMESTQSVITEIDKEIEKAKPATSEQQKEISDYCYGEVIKYWENHDTGLAWSNIGNSVDDVEVAYNEFFKNGKRTYKEKIEFDEKYYNDAMGNSKKNWNSKIVSGHIACYLRKLGIKHRYVHYDKLLDDGKMNSSDCIMYAVSERSSSDKNKIEENWYILDMGLMSVAELSSKFMEQEKWKNLYCPLTQPKDAAAIGLEDYADNKAFGFCSHQVLVFGNNDNALLEEDCFLDIKAPLIGEWVYRNCTENFKKRYLVINVSEEELDNIKGAACSATGVNFKLSKLSRRLFLEEKSPASNIFRSFSLVVRSGEELKKFPSRAAIPYDDNRYFRYFCDNFSDIGKRYGTESCINGIPFEKQFI